MLDFFSDVIIIIFSWAIFLGIPLSIFMSIRNKMKKRKDENERHKKEMELMQAQLEYYKNSSKNDT